MIQDPKDLKGYHKSIKNNFYISNSFAKEWPDTKIIITYREESLSEINQRELVFGPVDEQTGVSIPGSYLEYSIQPFSDMEITAYLRRYVYDRFPNAKREAISIGSHDLESSKTEPVSSWSMVNAYEDLINTHKSREILRFPLLLSIAVDILRDIAEQGCEKVPYLKVVQRSKSRPSLEDCPNSIHQPEPETLFDRWFYYEAYINRLLSKAIATESRRDLWQRLQFHALSKDKYVIDRQETSTKEQGEKLDDLLVSSSLLSKTSDSDEIHFVHPSVREFLLAQAIYHEIKSDSNPKTIILNQKLLDPQSQVMDFLVDSYRGSRLDADILRKFVSLGQEKFSYNEVNSKNEGVKEEKKEDNRTQSLEFKSKSSSKSKSKPRSKSKSQSKSKFKPNPETSLTQATVTPTPKFTSSPKVLDPKLAVIAANAMTILNLAKFDFSKLDLSGICIPGAYLSYGKFEGTDFSGSNLTGVDFTKASLKDTNFFKANLTDIEFGVLPDVTFPNHIYCYEWAPNGQQLAVSKGVDLIIFEKDAKGLFFKEVRTVSCSYQIESVSFSSDGKWIACAGRNGLVHIYDVPTGSVVMNLLTESTNQKVCAFNAQDTKLAIALGDGKIQVWNTQTTTLLFTAANSSHAYLSCQFNPNEEQILYIDSTNWHIRILNAKNGKQLQRFYFGLENGSVNYSSYSKRQIVNCKFVLGGRQVMSHPQNSTMVYSDTIRNYQLKQLRSQNLNQTTNQLDARQTIFLKDQDIVLQDTATGESQTVITGRQANAYPHYWYGDTSIYRVSPDNKKIAKLGRTRQKISFIDIPSVLQRRGHARGGGHSNGLELTGSKIESAFGLLRERIPLFIHHGDYTELSEDMVHNLILDSSGHENIKEISLTSRITDQTAKIFGRNVTWTNLEKLELPSNNLRAPGAIAIVTNTTWVNLKKLDLSKNYSIGNEGVIEISKNCSWPALEELNLSFLGLNAKGAEELSKNVTWINLKKLILSGNRLGYQGVSNLAKNTTWANLESLQLDNTRCKNKGLEAFSSNTTWKKLKQLDLSNCEVTYFGLKRLAKNKTWKNLEELKLTSNQIDDIGLEELSGNTTWKNLQILIFDHNPITFRGLQHLAENETWKNLSSLSFEAITLGEEGTKALSLSKNLSKLQTLNLFSVSMGDQGLEAIATNSKWSNLTTVNLGKNYLSSVGIEAIAKNACWPKLESLNLANNSLGDGGLKGLAKNKQWKCLKKLILTNNQIGAAGIKSLAGTKSLAAKSNPWENLAELDLSQNKVNGEGAKALGGSTCWTKLRILNLAANVIAGGVEHIGANNSWKDLHTLRLEGNGIQEKGLESLGKNDSWKNLELLSLFNNQIDPVGLRFLTANSSWVNLKILDLSANPFSDPGALVLANNGTWANLEEINLQHTFITQEGIEVLRKTVLGAKCRFS